MEKTWHPSKLRTINWLPKFNGKDYEDWVYAVQVKLGAVDLFKIIEGRTSEETDAALAIPLLRCFTPHLQSMLKEFAYASEIWDALALQYGPEEFDSEDDEWYLNEDPGRVYGLYPSDDEGGFGEYNNYGDTYDRGSDYEIESDWESEDDDDGSYYEYDSEKEPGDMQVEESWEESWAKETTPFIPYYEDLQ